ncbi:PocR ligand-binding domain-containing protein [Rhodocyclus tenuis]|uniref:diguanylate cyclase n=1 Tax=Rhodocyclus tenuis TaxID=1066 RepID=A0A840GA27_RHOTE|nr:PocR ligand-binding domain-containing protein [Rhodocyclus tenuis]MBB4248725.1 diguanylate cyclase (GGDEF)-like protein [Rhodocyclus tenuis]
MKFSELVDVGELQKLCESFTRLTGAVTAVLDLDGTVLVSTGWQDICTRFHRVNAQTAARCHESDTVLAGQLSHGEAYNVYQCKNGLVDVAVPISIGGEHVANFFTGQFFFDTPDRLFFSRQAQAFGFDESAYLRALDKAPVFSAEHVRAMMEFFTRLAQIMGEMGLARAELKLANDSLQASEANYRQQATTDFLTGLPSRRSFIMRLEDELARLSRTSGQSIALLMLDLDHFKQINDRCGHATGDALLRHFAVQVADELRRIDMAGRIGGEEFAIVLPGADQAAALAFAHRLCERVANSTLHYQGESLSLTVSIGVTDLRKTDTDPDVALARADKALYLAKERGRNRVELAE